MRIVVLGAGGKHKTEASIARAARALGHQCRLVNVVGWLRYAGGWGGRWARRLTDSFEPDFLLVTRHAIEMGESTLKALLRDRPAVFWYFDYEPKEKVLALGRLVGRMYVTCLGRIESYRSAGIPEVKFLPQGVDPEQDRPAASAPPAFHCDASFVGSGQSAHRYEVLRAVARVSTLQIRGPGWSSAPRDLPIAGGPVHGRRLARVIRGAAVSLGVNTYPAQDAEQFSVSNRMWRVMGCGGFYLGRRVAGIEQFAIGGRHCDWYSSSEQAAELVRHYVSRPDERERLAEAGRRHVLDHHTYAHRLALLLAGDEYPLHTIL
jgi:spore maturation protein CgeB